MVVTEDKQFLANGGGIIGSVYADKIVLGGSAIVSGVARDCAATNRSPSLLDFSVLSTARSTAEIQRGGRLVEVRGASATSLENPLKIFSTPPRSRPLEGSTVGGLRFNGPMTEGLAKADTPAGLLTFARSERATADLAEARQLQAAVAWAAMHSVDSLADAAHLWERSYGDTGVPVAGPGAPLVAEFSVAEFAAAVGLSTTPAAATSGGGRAALPPPRVWARSPAGTCRRGRPAASPAPPSPDPAGRAFVDGHVAHVAHRIGPGPAGPAHRGGHRPVHAEEAERRRRAASDGRRFDVDTRDPSLAGDRAGLGRARPRRRPLDLDAAVAAGAEQLKALGSTDSLDVRRAAAAGELARRQQTLDLNLNGRRGQCTTRLARWAC